MQRGPARPFACVAALALASACTHAPFGKADPLPLGAKYVAMGSSFAAGPGIEPYAQTDPAPCYRSINNYARQVANRKGLALTDVSCSGATTAHLTGPRSIPQTVVENGAAIPPQLDALTADTRLVTITIGGNDLSYIGRLVTASCAGLNAETGATTACTPIPAVPTEQDYADLGTRMDHIADEVRRRSPEAELVFVDYLAVLPANGSCAATPLSDTEADLARQVARRLADITAKTARDAKAKLVRASTLSANHDACANDPWMHGYPRPNAPVSGAQYHPNLKGMSAVADELVGLLW